MTQLDASQPIRSGEELDVRALESYLRDHLEDFSAPLTVEQFPSGFSNLTYLLHTPERDYVLRRPPFGAKIATAHDMEREFKVLSLLQPHYSKVPTPLLYCESDAVIGAPFYLMERVTGVVLRAQTPPDQLPDEKQWAALCENFVSTLVELHSIDIQASGLEEFGHPEGYNRRQVEGWTKRYRRAQTDEWREMDAAAGWLAQNTPAESGACLVHNDFKYDNLVLDPTDPRRILTVLDWEMATVGDPLMDLGTSLGYWTEADDPKPLQLFGLTQHPGNWTRRQIVEQYQHLREISIASPHFYLVYGIFKIGVIVQQIYARYHQGATGDPRFAHLHHVVAACGQKATQVIEREEV